MTEVIAIACAAIGVVLSVGGVSVLKKAFDSTNWVVCEGLIIISAVSSEATSEGVTWRPNIAYEYYVNNIRYVGACISFRFLESLVVDHCENLIAQLPVGSRHEIFYNPLNPKESVIHNGVDVQSFAPLAAGLCFFGVTFYLLMYK